MQFIQKIESKSNHKKKLIRLFSCRAFTTSSTTTTSSRLNFQSGDKAFEIKSILYQDQSANSIGVTQFSVVA